MQTAELLYEDGNTKKNWVLSEVAKLSKEINYDVDLTVVGNLIDKMCDMSKIVNAPEESDG